MLKYLRYWIFVALMAVKVTKKKSDIMKRENFATLRLYVIKNV